MIPLLIRVVVLVLLAVFVVYIVRSLMGAARAGQGQGDGGQTDSALKCSGCRHFRGAEDDGVFCASGDFETYKTFDDVEKCIDYARPG